MHRLYFSTRKIRCLHFCLLLQSQFEGVQLLEAVVKVAKPLCDRGEQAGEEHKFSERGQVSTVVCRRRLFRVSTQSMKNQNSIQIDRLTYNSFHPFSSPRCGDLSDNSTKGLETKVTQANCTFIVRGASASVRVFRAFD